MQIGKVIKKLSTKKEGDLERKDEKRRKKKVKKKIPKYNAMGIEG